MSTWVSPYQNVCIFDLLGTKDDSYGGDNCRYKMWKAPVKLSPPTNIHPAFYKPGALPVTQPTAQRRSTEGKD